MMLEVKGEIVTLQCVSLRGSAERSLAPPGSDSVANYVPLLKSGDVRESKNKECIKA